MREPWHGRVNSTLTRRSAPSAAVVAALERIAPGRVRCGAPLSKIGRWRIGGPADAVAEPASVDELAAMVALLDGAGIRRAVVGEGSNVLFDSAGYRGVILRLGVRMSRMSIDQAGGVIAADAGVWVPALVRRAIAAGLDGLGHAVGIPGMIGGLVVMNGGSMRQCVGDRVAEVTVVEPGGATAVLDRDACGFSRRNSVFLGGSAVIAAVRLRLDPGVDPRTLRRQAVALLAERRRKFPRALPNCGSVFVSDPSLHATLGPPGAAIEAAGLKGAAQGGARISRQHANFIVNESRASSDDVLALVALARKAVHARTGVWMRAEVRHLPPEGDFTPAHISAGDPVGSPA